MNTKTQPLPHTTSWRTRALPAAIMLGLLASTPALAAAADNAAAQTQQSTAATPQAQQSDKARNNAQNESNAQELGTVEVTATGRLQTVITVPYNIDVVSGDMIERTHIQDNAELFRSIPGVNVVDSGPRNAGVVNMVHMRGVNVDSSALGDYAVTAAPTVATYVDSVPMFANFLLMDINRVEVLKGPQGTLYGSGSLGGTVRYILNKPDFSGFYGSASASLSSVKDSASIGNSESLMLNVPLGNTFAVRFAGRHNDFPGVTDYVDLYKLDDNGNPIAPDGILAEDTADPDLYTTKKDADWVRQDFGRISALWKPNDDFSAQLSYQAQADRFGARRGTSLGTNGFGRGYDRNELGAAQLEPAQRHVHMTELELNADLGFATLTSSTSHYNHVGSNTSDNTGFYAQNGWYAPNVLGPAYYNYPRPMSTADRFYRDKAFTQEFRLISDTGGPFDYILGAYYHDQKSKTGQDSYLANFLNWWNAGGYKGPVAVGYWGVPAIKDAIVTSHDYYYRTSGDYREIALYGQGIWHATDNLQFTLGVRTFRDKYTAEYHQHQGVTAADQVTDSSRNTEKNHKTLFYGNMSWWFSDSSQLYATVSEGYRRGGANSIPTSGAFAESPNYLTYKPDTLTNYEIGIKGAGSNFSYTADVFMNKWKDVQYNTATDVWAFFIVDNLPQAEVKGVELEWKGKAGDHFTYGLGYSYTDAKLTQDAYTAGSPTLPAFYPPAIIGTDGQRLPGVSKQHLNASGNYSFNAGPGLLTFHADASYQSSAENALSQSPLFKYTLPGFTMWNASVSYDMINWTASLWLKNITNTKGATGIYKEQYMGADVDQKVYTNGSKLITSVPRTVGVTFTYRF